MMDNYYYVRASLQQASVLSRMAQYGPPLYILTYLPLGKQNSFSL